MIIISDFDFINSTETSDNSVTRQVTTCEINKLDGASRVHPDPGARDDNRWLAKLVIREVS